MAKNEIRETSMRQIAREYPTVKEWFRRGSTRKTEKLYLDTYG